MAAGHYLRAGLSLAFAIPVVGQLGAEIGEVGRAGETAAGIIKNTRRIESLTGTAAYRIPDELNDAEKIIGEVKNVDYQPFTRQLRDYAAFAKKYGYSFRLYVRQATELSTPLQDAVDDGAIDLVRNLP